MKPIKILPTTNSGSHPITYIKKEGLCLLLKVWAGVDLSWILLSLGRVICFSALSQIFVLTYSSSLAYARLHSYTKSAEPPSVVLIQSPSLKKEGLRLLLKVWAGVDSNHRTLARTDLQSVAFSHSATYPYLFVIILYNVLLNLVWLLKMPLTRFELVASPLRRECSTPEPQGHLDSRKAGNGTRTYNLRFTKPLLCQLSYAGLVFV